MDQHGNMSRCSNGIYGISMVGIYIPLMVDMSSRMSVGRQGYPVVSMVSIDVRDV